MRLFIAIELPDDARQHLAQVRDRLKAQIAGASFPRDQNLHITLKFLGEVEPNRIDELSDSLAQVRAAAPIKLLASGIKCFPPRGPARVVSANLDGELNAIQSIHAEIERQCEPLGFGHELRDYQPHVTLARAKSGVNPAMRRRIESSIASDFPGPTFFVSQIALIESKMKKDGSQYIVIKRFMITPNIY